MNLRIAGVVNDSIVDGPGIRFTIFTQGCPHHCPGCHNPQTHDFSGGTDISIEELFTKIVANPLLDGVTFSGGEPFSQAEALAALANEIHKQTKLNVVTYTGYTFEQIHDRCVENPSWKALLEQTDILIDGPYMQEKQSYEIRFRGSTNQRYLDAKESLRQHRAIDAIL